LKLLLLKLNLPNGDPPALCGAGGCKAQSEVKAHYKFLGLMAKYRMQL
jgi:hypothetical protein